MNKRAIERFAETTHEVYAGAVGAEFGKAVPSIFTDEPQFVHKETLGKAEEKKPLILPYTDDFEDSYRAAYGESFLDRLPEVVWELPDGVRSLTRYRYHDHIAQRFAEALGVPYEGHAGKPKSGGFQRAMGRMGVTPAQTAIVGDQIFTDIWGGNNAGVLTLLVHPIRFGTIFRVLRYGIETPFRAGARPGDAL